METVQKVSSWVSRITVICLIAVAVIVLIMRPTMYLYDQYTLIHWLGIGLLVIIFSMKISDYAGLFMNPKKALLSTVIQLICLPFIIRILMTYFHLPLTIASSIGLALLTPDDFSKNLFKNLFLAAAMFFVSWYILPSESAQVNQAYQTTTAGGTKMFLLVIALSILAYYEFKRYQKKKMPTPTTVQKPVEKPHQKPKIPAKDDIDVYYVNKKM